MILGHLIPCGGGDPIPLMKEQLLVGRRSKCDISLRFPNVSSQHCSLELQNGYWFVRDLGSRNGLKVNGTRCDSKWLLPGDVLSIAKHTFEVSYTPDGDAPPPAEEDIMSVGLLEKAGLVNYGESRPPRRPPAARRNPEPPAERRSDETTDEDVAMNFLTDDAED